MKKTYIALAVAATVGALTLTARGGDGAVQPDTPVDPPPTDPLANAPSSIRTTWFGISNWHYQIGDVGFILDGEVVNAGRRPNPAAVTKALSALEKKGRSIFSSSATNMATMPARFPSTRSRPASTSMHRRRYAMQSPPMATPRPNARPWTAAKPSRSTISWPSGSSAGCTAWIADCTSPICRRKHRC